jgi:hypothetical protein
MSLENHEYLSDTRNLHDKCQKYMYHHVMLTLSNGSSFDGIIEDIGNDQITVLVGEDVMERESDELEERQYYGYGRPRRRRFRRFRRQVLPLAFLTALSLLSKLSPLLPILLNRVKALKAIKSQHRMLALYCMHEYSQKRKYRLVKERRLAIGTLHYA